METTLLLLLFFFLEKLIIFFYPISFLWFTINMPEDDTMAKKRLYPLGDYGGVFS